MKFREDLIPTPDEVYNLTLHRSVKLMDVAMEISQYCDRVEDSSDFLWRYLRKIQTIFFAGYMLGKREERAKRKGKTAA